MAFDLSRKMRMLGAIQSFAWEAIILSGFPAQLPSQRTTSEESLVRGWPQSARVVSHSLSHKLYSCPSRHIIILARPDNMAAWPGDETANPSFIRAPRSECPYPGSRASPQSTPLAPPAIHPPSSATGFLCRFLKSTVTRQNGGPTCSSSAASPS